jgi:flagellar L-ring protein precursor FlgH
MNQNMLHSTAGRYACALGALAAILACVVSTAGADSLFPTKQMSKGSQASGTALSLYADVRAHGLGDSLTVVIAENTSASSSAGTTVSKNETANVLNGLFGGIIGSTGLGGTNTLSAGGSGTTTRTGTLVTTLSVLVKEILPNGNFRIEGSRQIGINKETQKVTFSGIVRPEDIAADNTIQSTQIASVEIKYDGKGIVGETQKPGILTRIYHFLF